MIGLLRRGSIFFIAVFALATFAGSGEMKAQVGKSPPSGSGASGKAKANITPQELYGDQGGQKVAAANARLPNTLMRARREDTFFKLSNPRLGKTNGKAQLNALLVDYEMVSQGKFDGGTLVLHTSDGDRAEVAVKTIAGRDQGTIELVGAQRFGNRKFAKNITFPKDLELYLTRTDDRYDPPGKFMVSNSVAMGKMRVTTRARNWTSQEIAIYGKAPPSYKNANPDPEIGEDVPALPADRGGRYVEPEGRLLGLDYSMGEWEKRKTLSTLTPVFSADQPKSHTGRSIARKGYAVAGAEVNADKYVYGIRLLFRRVKPDGTLDAKDAYAGNWIGVPPAGEATKLVNDGRRVLGIHIIKGAIIDQFALVVERQDK